MGNISFIHQDTMEKITQGILYQHGYSLDYDEGTLIKVPIDEIIEFYYKIDISWEPIDHLNASNMVMAAIFPTQRKIVMNDSCKELFVEKNGTMNFTMAHELGHWVLHVEDKLNQQLSLAFEADNEVYYCRSFSKKPPEEIQADMFAGCLLMPKTIIVPLINHWKRVSAKIGFPQLYDLCEMFDVSISALKIRLHTLNLLYIDGEGIIHASKEDYQEQMALRL